KARLTPVEPHPGFAVGELAFIVLMIGAAVATWWYGDEILAPTGLTGNWAMVAKFVAAIAAFLIVRALADVVGRSIGGGFPTWREYTRGRVHARWRDHRFWMFLVGIGALGLTTALLMGLPQQFQPETDDDTTQVTIEMVPGTRSE